MLKQCGIIPSSHSLFSRAISNLAPKAHSVKVMRVVVREDFSRDRCDLFIRDLMKVVESLDAQSRNTVEEMKRYRRAMIKTRWHSVNFVRDVSEDRDEEQPPIGNMRGVC